MRAISVIPAYILILLSPLFVCRMRVLLTAHDLRELIVRQFGELFVGISELFFDFGRLCLCFILSDSSAQVPQNDREVRLI